mgnify:FL=1
MANKGEQISSGRLVRFFDPQGELKYGQLDNEGRIWETTDYFQSQAVYTGESYWIGEVRLAAPSSPQKIIAVGLNYRDHAQEMGEELPQSPVLFLKPPTAVIGHEEEIVLPPISKQVDYEAELAVIIGRKCRNISPQEADSVILGYSCFNDVTARDLQKQDGQWTRAKSFDTFAPLGPWIQQGIDPGDLPIELYLNGERKQASSTSQLVFSVPELVSAISQVMTLLPGDVIATGTPAGVGPLAPGDVVTVLIGGIGCLENRVSGGK